MCADFTFLTMVYLHKKIIKKCITCKKAKITFVILSQKTPFVNVYYNQIKMGFQLFCAKRQILDAKKDANAPESRRV